MGPLFIALIGVAGYIATLTHFPTKYRNSRSNSWMSYFTFLCWGLGIFIFAGSVFILIDITDTSRNIINYLGYQAHYPTELGFSLAQFKLLIVSLMSVLLSILISGFFKWFYNRKRIDSWVTKYEIKSTDMLERLSIWISKKNALISVDSLEEFHENCFHALITLKSKKVYVGQIELPFLDNGHAPFVKITPMLSGYRDQKDLRFKPTIVYIDHFQEDERFKSNPSEVFEEYLVVVPREEIESVSTFNLKVFLRFQTADKEPQVTIKANFDLRDDKF